MVARSLHPWGVTMETARIVPTAIFPAVTPVTKV
jgi:hypothetical protein